MWVWPHQTTQESELGATEWAAGCGSQWPRREVEAWLLLPRRRQRTPHDGCHCPGLRLTPCHVRHHTARQRRPHMWLVALQGVLWELGFMYKWETHEPAAAACPPRKALLGKAVAWLCRDRPCSLLEPTARAHWSGAFAMPLGCCSQRD